MPTREPPEGSPGTSVVMAIIQLIREVLESWPKVMRAVVLISAPIICLVVLAGLGATVVFYLKVDPQRWGAVVGLGVTAMTIAKSIGWIRNRAARRRTSVPADGAPSVTQGPTRAEAETGASGDGEGNDDVSQ
jgi:hypothetical protein